MDEDLSYLEPDFEPMSYTIPKLRNVLLKHDIHFPSAAKKAELVQIFNDELVPKAPSILGKVNKTKPSARGIVDATQYGSIGEPVTETPRKRASRRNVSAATATDDEDRGTADEAPPTTSRKRRTGSPVKKSARKVTPLPKEETTPEPEPQVVATPKRGKTRKSLAAEQVRTPEPETPQVTIEEPSQEVDREDVDDEPAFSSINPFQRGSSPRSPPVDKDRRKTMPAKDFSKRHSLGADVAIGSGRRKTDIMPSRRSEPPPNDFFSPTPAAQSSRVVSVPIERFKKLTPAQEYVSHQEKAIERMGSGDSIDEEDMEPGEEFTPEAAMEVMQADAEAEYRAMGKLARRRNKHTESSGSSSSITWAVLAMLGAGYFAWWRKEKLEVGYCGIGKIDTTPADMPDWTTVLRPQCEPCPSHAICYQDLETKCEPDYVLVSHPLSLGGLVPLAPTCQPDSDKLQGIATLTNEAIKRLRNRAAEIECGEVKLEKGEDEGITEFALKREFFNRKAISDAHFEDLWSHALKELEKKDEIKTGRDSGGDRVYRSTDLSNISLRCSIRRAVKSSIVRYRIELVGLLIAAIAALQLRTNLTNRRLYNAQVSDLVHYALKALAQQQRQYYASSNTNTVPYISVNQLRDQVLQREFDPERRKQLWAGVSKVVEANSNVRSSQMEVSGGDVSRCWTWIGSSALLEEGGDDNEDDKDEQQGGGSRLMIKSEDGAGKKKRAIKAEDERGNMGGRWNEDVVLHGDGRREKIKREVGSDFGRVIY